MHVPDGEICKARGIFYPDRFHWACRDPFGGVGGSLTTQRGRAAFDTLPLPAIRTNSCISCIAHSNGARVDPNRVQLHNAVTQAQEGAEARAVSRPSSRRFSADSSGCGCGRAVLGLIGTLPRHHHPWLHACSNHRPRHSETGARRGEDPSHRAARAAMGVGSLRAGHDRLAAYDPLLKRVGAMHRRSFRTEADARTVRHCSTDWPSLESTNVDDLFRSRLRASAELSVVIVVSPADHSTRRYYGTVR